MRFEHFPSSIEGRDLGAGRFVPGRHYSTGFAEACDPNRQNQLDIRLKRLFRVRGLSLEAQADACNALNTGVVLTQVQTFGSALDRPATILQGRLFRFGMQPRW